MQFLRYFYYFLSLKLFLASTFVIEIKQQNFNL